MKWHWLVAGLLSSVVVSPAAAQSAAPLAEAEAFVEQGNYGEGLVRLLAARGSHGSLRTDGLIARCACEIPAKRELGLRLFSWILEQSPYKMNRAEQARLTEQAVRCGYSPAWVRVSLELPARGQAGMSGASKLFHLLPKPGGDKNAKEKEMGVTTEPLRFKTAALANDPNLAKQFRERVFASGEAGAATKKIRAVVGSKFKVVATDSFILASSGNHSEEKLRQIGEELQGFADFLETTYSLVPVDHLVTLYLLPSKEDLRTFAGRVHSLSASPLCIGYSFPADASIVAVIPGEKIGTLRHELVHTLVTSRFPDLPAWLDEGLASLYEESRREGDRAVGVWGWRQEVLKQLWGLRPTIPVLLEMSRAAFHAVGGDLERQAVNHAMARTLLLFVQEKQRLPEVFAAFRNAGPLDAPASSVAKPVDRLADALKIAPLGLEGEFVRWFKNPLP